MKFNYDYCKEKMQTIADRLQVKHPSKLPDVFTQLNHDLGLPLSLRELRLTKEDIKLLAEKAKNDHRTATNPRPLDAEDCLQLHLEAW